MEQQNQDRNWAFDVNLAGVNAAVGKSPYVPEDFYKGKVSDMYVNPEKPGRIIIKLSISEGEFMGVVRTTGLNIPTSGEDKVRHFWRAFAESVGYSPADLDKGQIKIGPSAFVGKATHFHYIPKDATEDKAGDDLYFLPPTEWNQQRQAFAASAPHRAASRAAQGAGGGSALGGSTARAAAVTQGSSQLGGGALGGGSSLGDNGAATKDEVLSRLGLGGGQNNGGGTLGA
jgi:hypothetical protein